MAVYTDVSDEELRAFIAAYDLGAVLSCKGIAEGVENSNYLVVTERGPFILTLYEKRVREADLPYFLGLMEHLAGKGIACPLPVRARDGVPLRRLAGRPAAIVTFLNGMWPRRIVTSHCTALGGALAGFHAAGADFPMTRPNDLSVPGWRPLFDRIDPAAADALQPGLAREIADELDFLEESWPASLPRGTIHADLFPDNVFFADEALTGFIDFYFACTDWLAYDLAVCLNAWCFEPDGTFAPARGGALIRSYEAVRPLEPAERAALPILARGAALRFLLTRLYDWINHPAGALVRKKDPLEYFRILAFHRTARDAGQYGAAVKRAGSAITAPDKPVLVDIFTDGACSGNPGPGGWGALMRFGKKEKELSGGEAHTTNNRMELMGAIAALEALKRPAKVRLHTDSVYLRDGITKWLRGWKAKGWMTADKQPVKNIDLWQRLEAAAAPHKIEWLWVKGHSGHPENDRVDELAREEIRRMRAR